MLLDPDAFEWLEIEGSADLPFRVHHDLSILAWDRDAGTIDLVIRFDDQGGHCAPHRHITTTSVLVLAGEQHLTDLRPDGSRPQKVRPAGGHHLTSGDEFAHLERGGPEGAVVFYSHHTDDGRLYEIVDPDGDVVHTVTLDSLVATWEARPR